MIPDHWSGAVPVRDWIQRSHRLTLLFLFLMIAGCSTLSIDPALSTVPALSDSWLLRGKLGIRSDNGAGNLQVVWQQSGREFDVHFMGPLGQVVAHVHGAPERFWLDMPGQEPRMADQHSREITEALGWELPVLEMMYWVRGNPMPGIPRHLVRDSSGRLETLQQSGWRVEFKAYEQGSPVRTRFVKNATVIILVVKDWQLLDE
jgi:outer membrane lipoprotein LolB